MGLIQRFFKSCTPSSLFVVPMIATDEQSAVLDLKLFLFSIFHNAASCSPQYYCQTKAF